MNSAERSAESGEPRRFDDRPVGALRKHWLRLLGPLLSLSLRETKVSTRRFAVESTSTVDRIEGIGDTFAQGYNGAVRSRSVWSDAGIGTRPARGLRLCLRGCGNGSGCLGLVLAWSSIV